MLWTVGISNWNISERVSMLQNKYFRVNLVKQSSTEDKTVHQPEVSVLT